MYVALEGIDGSGKTTICQKLKEDYPNALCIREPGYSEFSEEVRSLLFNKWIHYIHPTTVQCLLFACRVENFSKPELLDEDAFIISDRCFISCSTDTVSPFEQIKFFLDWGCDHFDKKPDAVIYIEVTPETSLKRQSSRKEEERTVYDNSEKEVIVKRLARYNESLEYVNNKGIMVFRVDGNKPFDEVYEAVKNLITSITTAYYSIK